MIEKTEVMSSNKDYTNTGSQPEFIDRFSADIPRGAVIGQVNAQGIMRQGRDAEGIISIDNGALRIEPLLNPGWARAGLAYGPYQRKNGLAFGVFMLNGHNPSQTGHLAQPLFRRLGRWTLGSGVENPLLRLWNWSRYSHKRYQWRQLRRWILISQKYGLDSTLEMNDNLVVGWYPSAVPVDPLSEGNGFVVHSLGPENGELQAFTGNIPQPVIRGIQNLPVYLVIVLREQGAAYYAASVPGAHGFSAYPQLRPLAIDPYSTNDQVYAAVYQSVLGQIGFRVDTRVYRTQVTQIKALETWYGTAHAADLLDGSDLLAGSPAVKGGVWTVLDGGFLRSPKGAVPLNPNSLAVLDPGEPSGLVSVNIKAGTSRNSLSLIWRFKDKANYWQFQINGEGAGLILQEDGNRSEIALDSAHCLSIGRDNNVQIIDDGSTFGICLNGHLLFDTWFKEQRLQTASGIGLHSSESSGEVYLSRFEAHPRSVPAPAELQMPQAWMPAGNGSLSHNYPVVSDTFSGVPVDLSEHTAGEQGPIWKRELGKGRINLSGSGTAKVVASSEKPNPGRTIYSLPWDDSNYADLTVTITPPGTAQGQWEKGRGGLVFWQDIDNYLLISTYLDDWLSGTSISSFIKTNGFDELYDAVWTNVGTRLHWGVPYDLRVVFDGMHYLIYLDQEPVLYRALTDIYPDIERLQIRRVGITANWEWGNDTGSVFHQFTARSAPDRPSD